MVDMPAAVDDDMPVHPGEQRRGRRKKRYEAHPEVVLGANGFEFGNCAYFGFGILEPRSCPSVPHIEPFSISHASSMHGGGSLASTSVQQACSTHFAECLVNHTGNFETLELDVTKKNQETVSEDYEQGRRNGANRGATKRGATSS